MWRSISDSSAEPLAGSPAGAALAAPCAVPAPAGGYAMKPAEAAASGDWVTRYVARLHRLRFVLPSFWFVVFVAGMVAIGPVFGNLKIQVEPIHGDANYVASAALRGAFPSLAQSQPLIVLLRCADGCAASAPARNASLRLTQAAAPYITDGLLEPNIASYYSYADAGMADAGAGLLSTSGNSTEIVFFSTIGVSVTPQYRAMLVAMRAALQEALDAAPAGSLQGGITGVLVINADSAEAIGADIAASDSITILVSFLLLALALRSLRMVALTAAALAAAFGAAFLLTLPLSTALSTPNFTTSLLISTLVSLSLDYSLFLLTHFKRSVRDGIAAPAAVEAMLRSGGHTVLVSGSTLAACFLVLAILPVSIVRAPGIAATFAVFSSVVANLTLTPALLLTFPRFFAGAGCSCCVDTKYRAVAPSGVVPAEVSQPPPQLGNVGAPLMEEEDGRVARFWAALAAAVPRYRWSLAVCLTALLVGPFAYRLKSFQVSQEASAALPRGAPAAETLTNLQAEFKHTTMARLLGVAPASASANAAMSPPFFASAAAAVTATVAASAPDVLTAADVSGLAWYAGSAADATSMAAAVTAVSPCPGDSVPSCRAACNAAACSLRMLSSESLSSDGRAMIMQLGVSVDLSTPEGAAWRAATRAALHAVSEADPAAVTWHLLVDASPDSIAYVYAHIGTLVGVTTAVVFTIILAAFRSLAIAVRAVATLAVMEVCVFGAASAVFCQGVLGSHGTFSSDSGLFWLQPLLAFSLVTGLGLDYDIFLLSAITEARHAGWSDADALTLGLRRSGPVISWAGIIMVVAFSGFLFSHIPLLNQLGFFIVFAVLVDTFVVRPLLVPALMAILGPAAYWPARMPPPSLGPLLAAAKAPDDAQEATAGSV